MSMTFSRQSVLGFSIFEVMVVVVVLAVAALVIVPMMSNTDAMQVQAAADQLHAALIHVQSAAIANQQRLQLIFDVNANSYQICDEDGAPVAARAQLLDDVLTAGFGAGSDYTRVALVSASFSGAANLWYDRMGGPHGGTISDALPTLTSGTIVLQAGKEQRTITVSPVTGEITVQ